MTANVLWAALLVLLWPAAGVTEELARVNKHPITSATVEAFLLQMGPRDRIRFQTPGGQTEVLELLISREVLHQEAVRRGLDKKDPVKTELERLTRGVIILAMVERLRQEQVTEEAMRSYYESHQADFQEARARHILVGTEEEVHQLAAQLAQGTDFASLATKHSTDPGSRNQGGDLGFFRRGTMVAAFDEAVFALEINAVSKPVRTQFGYHLIKLLARRDAGKYDELGDAVQQALRRAVLEAGVQRLRSQATITYSQGTNP